VRLRDAENFPGFPLRKVALLDDAVYLQRQLGFQKFLFGVGQAEVGKNIATANLVVSSLAIFRRFFISLPFGILSRLLPAADESGQFPFSG
jgi:hypothetical protein